MAPSFNKLLQQDKTMIMKSQISFVQPAVATIDDKAALTKHLFRITIQKEEEVIFEERLRGDFKLFISNSRNNMSERSGILDAFCHYTYHNTAGDLVVCGLKGVQDKHSGHFNLTNPTIHSRDKAYGNKDRGLPGIKDFFCSHVCNVVCEHFRKPGDFPQEFFSKDIGLSHVAGFDTFPVVPSSQVEPSAPPMEEYPTWPSSPVKASDPPIMNDSSRFSPTPVFTIL